MNSKTWVRIHAENLRNNIRNIGKFIDTNSGDRKVKKMIVVKSNAYGHGIVECAKIIANENADFLAVDAIEEALLLRSEHISLPILVLGWISPELYIDAVLHNITITISSLENLERLQEVAKTFAQPIRVHLKIDTGLHRQGLLLADKERLFALLETLENITIDGVYTHLATAEMPELKSYMDQQIAEFQNWITEFHNRNMFPVMHAGASAIATTYSENFFDMVRIGISAYGLWPSPEIKKLAEPDITLTPVLTWESGITEIKEIPAGSPVGYDCTEQVSRDTKIAVVPIGYWHGLPRSASRKACLAVNGQKAKILGNVSMDMCVIDVTEIDCKVGDTVEIIGKTISAEEIAESCGTINYEVVTRINKEINRQVTEKAD